MWLRLFLLSYLTLVTAACSKIPGIKFDASVPSDQKELLEGDLQLVSSLNITNVNPYDLPIIGLPDLSGASLAFFLGQRVNYIVGESYSSKANESVLVTGIPFQTYYASLLDPSSGRDGFDASSSNVIIVMSNTGAAVYLGGKSSKTIYSLRVAEDNITVNSPRVGVIKIGSGLFNNSKLTGVPLDSLGARLIRLGTLFHESRHSDGNGSNAGFPHVECADGDLKGEYACEGNINGPYMVEARMLNYFYSVCYNCSATERAALQLAGADAYSRQSWGAIYNDPTPEVVR